MARCELCGGVKYPGLFETKCDCTHYDFGDPPPDNDGLFPSNENWLYAAILVLIFLGAIPYIISTL
jgi:hypothetical protein